MPTAKPSIKTKILAPAQVAVTHMKGWKVAEWFGAISTGLAAVSLGLIMKDRKKRR